jgi:hypothetical protein
MPSFLSPLFLIGSLAAVIPIVLHLLKREPEPLVKFPAVKLLKHAPVEYTEKRHVRQLVLLALRMAMLILIAVAFARPFFGAASSPGSAKATIIALDTSYSMSAPATFARAQALARDAVNRAAAGDLVGVVTFADTPLVAARPSADRTQALSAISAAAAGFGATRYRAALNASVQSIGDRQGSIVVVTDLQESGWDVGARASVPERVRVDVLDAGALASNLAITALRAERGKVIASVRNTGEGTREVRAHLALDSRPSGDATATVAGRSAVEIAFATAGGRSAAVSIDDPDGLSADNTRYVVLDGATRSSVFIVSSDGDSGRAGFYVRQALAASTGDELAYELTVVTPAQLPAIDTPRLSPAAAVVLLSTRGLERRGREVLTTYVRNGGGLLIAAGPDIDGEVVADVLGADRTLRVTTPHGQSIERSLVAGDVRHPLFRLFGSETSTLGLVRFRNVSQVEGKGCQSLARFTTGETALLECPAGDGRAIVFASDLENRWNDFPLHAAFVPFLHETLRYLATDRGIAPREVFIADAPVGVTRAPGIAALPVPEGAPRLIAVNVDPRESDPARLSPADFQNAIARLKDEGVREAKVAIDQTEDRQQFWRYLLLLALGVLALEGVVASRTA